MGSTVRLNVQLKVTTCNFCCAFATLYCTATLQPALQLALEIQNRKSNQFHLMVRRYWGDVDPMQILTDCKRGSNIFQVTTLICWTTIILLLFASHLIVNFLFFTHHSLFDFHHCTLPLFSVFYFLPSFLPDACVHVIESEPGAGSRPGVQQPNKLSAQYQARPAGKKLRVSVCARPPVFAHS